MNHAGHSVLHHFPHMSDKMAHDFTKLFLSFKSLTAKMQVANCLQLNATKQALLHRAARVGNLEVVDGLLQRAADPNAARPLRANTFMLGCSLWPF